MGTLLVFILVFCVLVALGCGVLSGWSDFRGMTISNLYPLLVLGAFVLAWLSYYFLAPDDAVYFGALKSHLLSGGILFAITFIMFSLGWLGAGDSKLASVYALWAGMTGFASFLFYMALAGGLLGVAALLIQKHKPFSNPAENSWVYKTQNGQSAVPYGIAIAFGAFVSFLQNGYLSPDRFLALAGGS
jgi:prepilin peptidase CpaA